MNKTKFRIGTIALDCLFAIEALSNICSGSGTMLDYAMLLIFAFIAMLLIYDLVIKK